MTCVAVLTCGHRVPLDDPDQDISVAEFCFECDGWFFVEHVEDAQEVPS